MALHRAVRYLVTGSRNEAREPTLGWWLYRPLAFVGMLSYGMYLWHYAVLEWLVRRLGCDPTSLQPCPPTLHYTFAKVAPLAVLLSIGLGAASWYLVERPIIRLTHRYRR